MPRGWRTWPRWCSSRCRTWSRSAPCRCCGRAAPRSSTSPRTTGCATAPLLKNGLARPDGIVIDGKSGVTGAGAQGRNPDPMYLYTEANENVQAYALTTHRHTPEMEQEMSALAGGPVRVSFTPHLVPL